MKLIAGLGNIGERYAGTRHNLGFMVIDRLIGERGLPACTLNAKFKARITEGNVSGEKVLLVKPASMMNLSGESIGSLAKFYRLPLEDLWIIHDDVDLPFGSLRIRGGGGSGGHNGISSIIAALGPEFIRFRLGVATPERPAQMDTADFVLSNFTKPESQQLPVILRRAAAILEAAIEKPVGDSTYNLLNGSNTGGQK
ncbi:aminoacyl-tRNA hydrolase [Candidatus Parcubacteria bacterium]|nr:aminoacyl-tRNA hydrolase [Candidatus Parcubacteria bacterium]